MILYHLLTPAALHQLKIPLRIITYLSASVAPNVALRHEIHLLVKKFVWILQLWLASYLLLEWNVMMIKIFMLRKAQLNVQLQLTFYGTHQIIVFVGPVLSTQLGIVNDIFRKVFDIAQRSSMGKKQKGELMKLRDNYLSKNIAHTKKIL